MRNLVFVTMALATLGFAGQPSVFGAIVTGELHLQGTGSGPDGLPNDASYPFDHYYSSLYRESVTVESYGYNGGLAYFNSTGTISADADGGIHALVEGTATGGWVNSPEAGGTASVNWYDSAYVVWAGSEPDPAPGTFAFTSLLLNFGIHGRLTTSPYVLMKSGAYFDFQPGGATWASAGFDAERGQTTEFHESLTGLLDLHNSSAEFHYRVRAFASTPAGVSRSDILHTMRLESVTFLDGTTPESHGYALVFESGMQSPNLRQPNATVPEPAAFVTWTLLAPLGLFISARRRGAVRSGTGCSSEKKKVSAAKIDARTAFLPRP